MDDLLGRRNEVELATSVLAEAEAGRGALIVISGEPGIGKTRLAEEVVAIATARGFATAWAGSWELGTAPAYWVWTKVLREVLSDASVTPNDRDRAQLTRLVPELGGTVPDASGETAQIETFETVVSTLRRLGAARPLLIVLDDIQWADGASRLLLEYLAAGLRDLRLAVLTTYRDTEPGDAAASVDRLSRLAVHIPLGALDPATAAEVAARAGGDELSTDGSRAVAARAGGNPFFVRELARLAVVAGAGAESLPRSVRAVLERRLARLPQPTIDMLSMAAVVGSEFAVRLLAAAADAAEEDALATIGPAVVAQLCQPAPLPASFAFAHPLVRSALTDGLSPAERARRHLAVADALEAHPELTSGVAEIAHHLEHAAPLVERDRLVRHQLAAARDAATRTAFDEAIGFYERVMGEMTDADASARCDVLLELGESRRHAGRRRPSRDVLMAAADLARQVGDGHRLARAALGMNDPHLDAGFGNPSPDLEALRLAEEALDALPEEDDATRARLLARLSIELRVWTDGARANVLAEEAIAMARRLGDDDLLRDCIVARGWHVGYQRPDALAELAAVTRGSTRPHLLLARALNEITEAVAASDLAALNPAVAAENSVATRFPSTAWFRTCNDGVLAHLHGDLARAELAALDLLDTPTDELFSMPITSGATLLFFIRWDQGRLIETAEGIRAYAERRAVVPCSRAMYALQLAVSGDIEQARNVYAPLVADDTAAVWDDTLLPPTLWLLSFLASTFGDARAARAIHRRLVDLPWRGFWIGVPAALPGHLSQALGITAATFGDHELADEHFAEALDAAQRMDAPLWRARTYAEWASSHGARGDQERARALASSTIAEATRHRALGIVARAQAVLDGLGHAPSPEADNAFVLEGRVWSMTFDGTVARLPPSRGLADIATLIARQGGEVHVGELMASGLVDGGGAPVLDRTAMAAYRARIVDLQRDIDDAESANDLERSSRARAELDTLIDELSRSVGIGGRSRRAPDATERARKAVQRRIDTALGRLDSVHPALARHLRRSIRTGQHCSYRPEPPVTWTI